MAIRQGSTLKKIIFIIGPTACGKTGIAVDLAEKINAEIVSCDSMQVYKGMEILAQAPAGTALRKIRHHLVSEINPQKEYSAALFSEKAKAIIERISKKGKTPLIVGGTGLYAKALVDGLFASPEKDERLRARLAEEKTEALYEKLKNADRESAAKIHPNDKRRIIRALEVYYQTGTPMSEHKKKTKGIMAFYEVKMIGLGLSRDILYRRIDDRVEKMFKAGLVKEVKRLLGKDLSKTAAAALGIKEVSGYAKGDYSLEEAKALLKKNTRHFAKKQLTWFKADKRIEWVDADKPSREVVRDIIDLVGRRDRPARSD